MANKRIDQLPTSDNQVQGTDLIPIFSDNKTERVTIDELGSYIGSSVDTYVTGATYSNGTLTLGRNDGVDLTVSGFLTGSTGGSGIGLQQTTVDITSSQILNGHSTPIELLPAPGANKAYVIYNILVDYTFGTTQYQGTTLQKIYNENLSETTAFHNINAASSERRYAKIETPTFGQAYWAVNDRLLWGPNGGSTTNGDGSVRVHLFYMIIDV